jgi:4-amino-4-deoxy-L-arabinose transferase-like glycosyltransferase
MSMKSRKRSAQIVITLLLLAAAAQYSWNAYTLPAFVAYDAKGHMQYIATIVDEGRLPHPLEGWSTFHPPFYYLLASLISWYDRPLWSPLALRAISALAILVAALVSFRLVLRLSGSQAVAGVAAALVLFVPCSQLSATMIGNEALGAGLAALAVPALLSLQMNPRNLRAATLAGLTAGLALATKYTGFFVAVASVVPFARADFDQRVLRALILCALVGAAVAGPVYVRNLVLTGSPIPMTRHLDPMKSLEESLIIRERRLVDYLWINPASLLRPSPYQVSEERRLRGGGWNPDMTSVWALTYAGMWYDPHAHRIEHIFHRDYIYSGPVLTLLGIVPTGMMLVGFISALREFLRRRGRSEDAPLVVMALVALAAFIAFTWRVPSTTAVKASYILPLVVPAALFFARGVELIGPRFRTPVLLISGAAVLAAAAVFTHGLVFPMLEPEPMS